MTSLGHLISIELDSEIADKIVTYLEDSNAAEADEDFGELARAIREAQESDDAEGD